MKWNNLAGSIHKDREWLRCNHGCMAIGCGGFLFFLIAIAWTTLMSE